MFFFNCIGAFVGEHSRCNSFFNCMFHPCFFLDCVWFMNFEDDVVEVKVFRTCEKNLEVKKGEVRPTLLGGN